MLQIRIPVLSDITPAIQNGSKWLINYPLKPKIKNNFSHICNIATACIRVSSLLFSNCYFILFSLVIVEPLGFFYHSMTCLIYLFSPKKENTQFLLSKLGLNLHGIVIRKLFFSFSLTRLKLDYRHPFPFLPAPPTKVNYFLKLAL